MLRLMRLAVGLFVTLSLATVSGVASAQPVAPLIPLAPNDTLSLPDARDVLVLQPLRLGLMSSAVPHAPGTWGCRSESQAAGRSILTNSPIAASGVRLFGETRLTLFGFARDGCAFDQLTGGGAMVSTPLTKNVMFMWGGGAIYLPHGAGNKPVTELELRAGVTWTTKSGRSYNVGLAARNGGPHVSFGGVF
jgi:hypothetical protein